MTHHPIFDAFSPTDSVGTGKHFFDFVGSRTNVTVKSGYEKHAIPKDRTYTPKYPPKNEHYIDWICLLRAVESATGIFRMAELGAGWAPWLVSGAFATRQMPQISGFELVGVEADPTHYKWAVRHIGENSILTTECTLLHGAVATENGQIRFPKLDAPDEDYGASIIQGQHAAEYLEVQGYTIAHICSMFSGTIDFLHSDIQGAEYDVFPNNMGILNESVRHIMIGTHQSTELHDKLKEVFQENGWICKMDYPRNSLVETGYGEIQFNDGVLALSNSRSL